MKIIQFQIMQPNPIEKPDQKEVFGLGDDGVVYLLSKGEWVDVRNFTISNSK